jgi:hypothetical protein
MSLRGLLLLASLAYCAIAWIAIVAVAIALLAPML